MQEVYTRFPGPATPRPKPETGLVVPSLYPRSLSQWAFVVDHENCCNQASLTTPLPVLIRNWGYIRLPKRPGNDSVDRQSLLPLSVFVP